MPLSKAGENDLCLRRLVFRESGGFYQQSNVFSLVGRRAFCTHKRIRTLLTGTRPSDVNPVIGDGCPFSIAGFSSAATLADRLNISLDLRPIEKPFLHFFGLEENSTERKWTVAEWLLPIRFKDVFHRRIP